MMYVMKENTIFPGCWIVQTRKIVVTIGILCIHDYCVGANSPFRSVSSSLKTVVTESYGSTRSLDGTSALSELKNHGHQLRNLTSSRRIEYSLYEVCPQGRRDPSSIYHILPYADTDLNDPAYDDLSEISSLAFTNKTDSLGRRYAYVVSDKEQFSLKVIRFDNYDVPAGGELTGDAIVSAVYRLDGVSYSNDDWEDMSLGPCSDETNETCIYIGNFGNNDRGSEYDLRTHFEIFKFPEPLLTGANRTPQSQTVPVSTIQYKYDDGGFHDGTCVHRSYRVV